MRASLNNAEAKAAEVGAHMVMIGILPTLEAGHMTVAALTPNPRYKLLSDQILAARGEDLVIDIAGPSGWDDHRLDRARGRLHEHPAAHPGEPRELPGLLERLAGDRRGAARPGRQLAVPAGQELWRETRIPLFEQATDTRLEELKAQGVRPRVWFGERWINSIFDLFEENVRYFPALLPIIDDEDPLAVLESGGTPTLAELRLHNGTIYRWNRPVYDVVDGMPHLRVENRVLPPGRPSPTRWRTPRSTSGWCAHWPSTSARCGRRCRSAPRRTTSTSRPRRASTRNVYWPGLGQVPATELVLRRLLPMARRASTPGASPEERDRLLGIIEQRCIVGQNGASWFADRLPRARGRRARPRRGAAADAERLPRAHARQRAGAHLGAEPSSCRFSRSRTRPTCAAPRSAGPATPTA